VQLSLIRMMEQGCSDHNDAAAGLAQAPRRQHEVPMISYSIRAFTLATAFAALAVCAAPTAQAAPFDGSWSVLVITRSGACDQSYRYGVFISNGIVQYAGGGPVSLSGRVTSSGNVSVRVSSGPQYAVGTGRLSPTSGRGTWRGQGPAGSCSGVWSASRG
jgi:hypothetical protein